MAKNPLQSNGVPGPDLSPDEVSLKVVIVGAGIAGLTLAVALRQQGHQVHVYEQSQLADEIGAAIHISPNANSVLQRLGIDVGERGATKLVQTRYHNSSCKLLSWDHNEAESYRWQESWLQAHRGHLHSQLKDKATSPKHAGPAACIHTSSRILEIGPQNATITLANGDIVNGDVLVGADGVRSITRRAVAGPDYDSFEIGKSALRFMVPRAEVLADPETREFGEALGSMDMFFAEEHKVIMYQCVNNTLLNIVCIHPAHQSNASAETYNMSVSREKLLEIFHDFSPKLLKVFEKCDGDTLKVYPLFDALSMPTFVIDRLALIGDAAHPFTPFIGQGGATAIEDAVSLGVMLSKGVTLAEVPERLQLYNKSRHERATRIQGYSRTAGGDGVKPGEEKTARMKGREHAFYALSHDEFHASTQVLSEHKWSKITGATWRQPTVFGPMPGPTRGRNNSSGNHAKMVTASIKFKTSGTLLRNMLPNTSYSFASKDTVALASLTIQSHRNVEWLGFHGFDRVVLEIHGINYTRPDNSVISGRYLPVMFENSADVISAGREERGYPSVFCDIEIEAATDGSFCANLSWKGVRWAKIWLMDLATAPAPERTNEGVFVHRCIPAVTDRPVQSENDTERDILIVEEPSNAELARLTNGADATTNGAGATTNNGTPPLRTLSRSSRDAGFEVMPHTQKELPTLHHIVSRLGELPIFDIVSAMVWEEEGTETVAKASRIS